MTFNHTNVVSPLQSGGRWGNSLVTIGGHNFPSDPGMDVGQRLTAIEEALASIYDALGTLSENMERIDRALQEIRPY